MGRAQTYSPGQGLQGRASTSPKHYPPQLIRPPAPASFALTQRKTGASLLQNTQGLSHDFRAYAIAHSHGDGGGRGGPTVGQSWSKQGFYS